MPNGPRPIPPSPFPSEHIAFNLLRKKDGSRVKQQFLAVKDGKPVGRSEMTKGRSSHPRPVRRRHVRPCRRIATLPGAMGHARSSDSQTAGLLPAFGARGVMFLLFNKK